MRVCVCVCGWALFNPSSRWLNRASKTGRAVVFWLVARVTVSPCSLRWNAAIGGQEQGPGGDWMDSVCVLGGGGQKPWAFTTEVPKEQRREGSTKATIAMTMCGNFGKMSWIIANGPKHGNDAPQCSAGILILCVGLCSAGNYLPKASCNMSFFF